MRLSTRRALVASAAFFAIGGPVPALLPVAIVGAVRIVRSPDLLFDAGYAAAFCLMACLVS